MKLRRVLLALLIPIARILMLVGVQAKEAVDIFKAAFVLSATEDLGRNDRPASMSHVSRATGLTRRETARLREKFDLQDSNTRADVMDDADILGNWYTDRDFLDAVGKPKPAGFGPGPGTFTALVSKYLPDSDPKIMLRRLTKQGYIAKADDGSLMPTQRHVSISEGIDAAVLTLGMGVRCLAHNIHHNLQARKGETWIQRNITNSDIPAANIPFARRAIRDRAKDFSFTVDDLLAAASAHSPTDVSDDGDSSGVTVGVGLYYYEIEI